ncbi:MAG TPA: hypothetical protein VGX23_09310 [Actinocrinis sp.]|nr:hypothetical protein [Actinocrinis sp.]
MRADTSSPATTRNRDRSNRTARRVAAVIIAAGTGAMLTACSSGSNGAAGSPAPAGSGAAGGSSSQAAAAGAGNGKATCTQLTKDQVQPLLTKPITNVTSAMIPDQVSVNGTAQQCSFAIDDVAQAIVVTVVGGADADNFFIGAEQSYGTPTSVPGIGAKAVRDGGDGTSEITAEDNGVSCSASIGDEGDLPGLEALEEAAGSTSAIGDKNYAVISTALGTLCNRVFGGGNTTPDLSGLSMSGVSTPTGGGLPTGLDIQN